MADTLQQAIRKRRSKTSHYKEQSNDTTIQTLSDTIVKYRSTIQANERFINELKNKNLELKSTISNLMINETAVKLQVIDLEKQLCITQEDFKNKIDMLSDDHNNQKSLIDQYQRLNELQAKETKARRDNLQYEEMKAKETQLRALEAETEVDETDKDETDKANIAKTKVKQKKRKKKISSSSLQKKPVKPLPSSKPNAWRM